MQHTVLDAPAGFLQPAGARALGFPLIKLREELATCSHTAHG